jgi:hypothetical protein
MDIYPVIVYTWQRGRWFMKKSSLEVRLGFADQKVPVGTHMCLIYTDEKERTSSLLKFLLSGLVDGERAACFSDYLDEGTVRAFFHENAISYDERKEGKAISLSGTREVYFKDGIFDPDRMLNVLSGYYEESLELGFPASRVCGEMSPVVETVPGGERLLEYEARVSILLRDHPVTAVCQYDANSFDGATILNVLKVHPHMIVNGAVVQNPFFVTPEKYLNLE